MTDETMFPKTVTLDLSSLTLGEIAAAEMQSGYPFDQLLRGRMTRRMLALFIHELRSSAQPRSWRELGDLRPFDSGSSDSLSRPAGSSPKSRA